MFKELVLFAVHLLLVATIQATSQKNKEAPKTIEVELKNTANGRLFYVELELGRESSENHAKFNMLVASIYYMTWIQSRDTDLRRGYESSSRGIHDNSPILKTGASYGGYHFKVHNETCQIGRQLVEDQPIAIADPQYDFRPLPREYKIDGILGLSGYDNKPEGTHYLFRNLYYSAHIDSLQFSLYINNTLSETKRKRTNSRRGTTAGALVLGGINEKYFKGEIKYAKLYHESDNRSLRSNMVMNKSLIVTKVELDWSRAEPRGEIRRLLSDERIDLRAPEANLRLDSSMILFFGPSKLLDQIHLDFIGATKVGINHLYVFDDCRLDNKADLVFTVDHLELKVRPEDYVVRAELDGRRVCLSAFKGYIESLWAFGTNFLRNYYTVFDYERQAVGFATPT